MFQIKSMCPLNQWKVEVLTLPRRCLTLTEYMTNYNQLEKR